MKLRALLFISIFFTGNYTYAQKGSEFYIKAGGEYAVPVMGTQGFDAFVQYDQNAANPKSVKTANSSFGKGIWTSFHVGYYITPNFGVDAGISMGLSRPEFVFKVHDGALEGQVTATRTKRPVLINPSLVYRVPFKNISIVGKTGLVVPVNTTLVQTTTGVLSSSTIMKADIRNRFALGFSCGVGAEYRLNSKFGLSLETNLVALKVDSKEMEVTSFVVNKIETIGAYSMDSRMTYYEYDISQAAENKSDPFGVSFSRLGLKLGFAFYF